MRALLAFVAGISSASCFYDFNRTVDVAPGDIAGVAVRADRGNDPAPFAQVAVQGGSLVRRTRSDGAFLIRGLAEGAWVLRFSDDDDGDNENERTAFSASRIVKTPEGDLSSILLGNVGLDGAFNLNGTVFVKTDDAPVAADALGLLSRVVLTRELCVPINANEFSLECSAAPSDRISVGVEAATGADAEGDYGLDGIGSGTIYLYGLLFAPDAESARLGTLVAIHGPVEVSGLAGDIIQAPQIVIDPIVDAAAPLTISVGLTPPPLADVTLLFSLPGNAPPCDGPFTDDVIVETAPPGGVVTVSAPPGIFDITACVGELRGFLSEALIVPPADPASPPTLGPILLSLDDPCGDPRDCDGDALSGLPPLVEGSDEYAAHTGTWTACASSCGDAFGANAGGDTCETPAGAFDCDDDGDGQPDVTEPQPCYGLGLGTDLDGDGICSGQDPYPYCSANDAARCEDGGEETIPDVVGVFALDICRERPFVANPICEFWAALDADSDERMNSVETVGLDADGVVVRGTNFEITPEGNVYLFADHTLFLPSGRFAWTFNEISSFPEIEIWDDYDASGYIGEQTIRYDEDGSFDGVAERIERRVFVPGRIDPLGDQLVAAIYNDTDVDCAPNSVQFFGYDEDGLPTTIESDDDADGVIDRSATAVREGDTATIGLPGDVAVTTRVFRDNEGRVIRAERDSDEDGLFETAATYDPTLIETTSFRFGVPRRLTTEFDSDGNGGRDRHRLFVYDDEGRLIERNVLKDLDENGVVELDRGSNQQFFDPITGFFRGFIFTGPDDFEPPGPDFIDSAEYAPYARGFPTIYHPLSFTRTDDGGTFVKPYNLADGCGLDPLPPACTVDSDCGADACNTVLPVPDPDAVDPRRDQGFELRGFCGPRSGAAVFTPCTGASFNNSACESGLCDDVFNGQCTTFCTTSADCPGSVCVQAGAYLGDVSIGRCALSCDRQQDCLGGGDSGRSCVIETLVEAPLLASVCDGDRGFLVPGEVSGAQNANECITHLMLSGGQLHEFECTERCIDAADCTVVGALCTTAAIETAAGPIDTALTVCVPQ